MLQIEKYRKAAGLNQSELADLMGVRPPTVFKWENGLANPSMGKLVKLADVLCVTVDALLGRPSA